MTKIIGITGGIASGKSTVSSYLRELGQIVIDADEVVHDLQKKGGVLYQVLVGWFGTEILQADGELNRKKLAALLFGSNERLAKSADLQNSIIRKELEKRRDRALQDNELVFLDIPLLYELGYEDWCNQVWLIYVD
ncbi:MAG: dephospho-CoA kinase, partial [Streptococcus orisratti]|uniref:dephospho-CoA kinase n=1 Tax=Streptococcus orisratti TaxID=114652 RepID=UPI00235301F8